MSCLSCLQSRAVFDVCRIQCGKLNVSGPMFLSTAPAPCNDKGQYLVSPENTLLILVVSVIRGLACPAPTFRSTLDDCTCTCMLGFPILTLSTRRAAFACFLSHQLHPVSRCLSRRAALSALSACPNAKWIEMVCLAHCIFDPLGDIRPDRA